MPHFIVYDHKGNILRTGIAPTEMIPLQAQDGELVLEGYADQQGDFIDLSTPDHGHVVMPRTQMNLVVVGASISGLPVPCTAIIDGERYDVDDGLIELDSDVAKVHSVTIIADRHLMNTIEVQT